MRKSRIYLLIIAALLSTILVATATFSQNKEELREKKAVMIIAHRNFRDEEFQKPKNILEEHGIKVIVASSRKDIATGMLGTTVKPDILISDINVKDYDIIIFVGGVGATEYWNNPTAHKIAQEALKQGKILCAICIAPVTLANAGILKGKKATVWPSERDRLEAKGALYTGEDVEVDGNIITASGPKAAEKFGNVIVRSLSEKIQSIKQKNIE